MRFIWNTAVKDWRRHRRNPLELILWIGIPLLVGGLLSLAFGGGDGPSPQAHLLVADEDNSFLSGFLIGALSQETAGAFVHAEEVDQREGRERMDKGGATALLIIPKGFSEAVLLEKPVALWLITNPSQRILPAMVKEGLEILTDGTFYVHRLIGDELRAFAQGPPLGMNTFPDAAVGLFSVRINQLMNRLGDYVSPPLMSLDSTVDETEDEGPSLSFGVLMLPTILFMALLFMAQGLSEDLWQERNAKTLRRVVVSPRDEITFLLGKVLSGVGLIFVVCVTALSFGYAYLALDLVTMPLALIWATCSGAMLMTLMMTIQLFAASQKAGSILTMAIMFPLMMVGGSFFPFEAMPGWMAGIGTKTPNGWALARLKDIVLGRTEGPLIAMAFVMLFAITAVFIVICATRLRRGFAQG